MANILDFGSDQFSGRNAETIIRVRDNTDFALDRPVVIDSGFSSFFVVKADKGRVNTMLRFNSVEEAQEEFGDYSLDSQGLTLFSAYRWLESGGTAFIIRIPDANYKPATSLLGVEVSFKKGVWKPATKKIELDSDDKAFMDALDIVGTQDKVNTIFNGLVTPDVDGNLDPSFYPLEDRLTSGSILTDETPHVIPSFKLVNRPYTYAYGQPAGQDDGSGNIIYKFNEIVERVTGIAEETEKLKEEGIYEDFRLAYASTPIEDIDLDALVTGTNADTLFIPLIRVESLGWGQYYNQYSIAIEPFMEQKTDDGQQLYTLIVIDNNRRIELERYVFSFFSGDVSGAYMGLDQVITELKFIKATLLSEQMGLFEGLMRTVLYYNAKNDNSILNGTTTTVVNTDGTKVSYVSGTPFNVAWTGDISINGINYTIDNIGPDTIVHNAVVDVATSAVTWKSGTKFNTAWTGEVSINGVIYNIASVTDDEHMTLVEDAGTGTDVAFIKTELGDTVITLTASAGSQTNVNLVRRNVNPATVTAYKEAQKYFNLLKYNVETMMKADHLKLYDFFGCRNESTLGTLFKSFTLTDNSRYLDRLSFPLSKGVSKTVFVGSPLGDYETAFLESIFVKESVHTPPTNALDYVNMNNTAFIVDVDYPVDVKKAITNYVLNVRDDISYYRNFYKKVTHESLIIDAEKFLSLSETHGQFKDLRTKNMNVRTFMEWCKIRDAKGRHIEVPLTVALIPAIIKWRLTGGRTAIAGLDTVVSDIVPNSMIPESLSEAKKKILSKYCVNYTTLTQYGYMIDSDHTNMYNYNGLMIHPHNVAILNEIKKEIHRLFLENRHLLNTTANLEEIKKQVNESFAKFRPRVGSLTYDYGFKSDKERSLGYVTDYVEYAPYGTLTKHRVDINIINQYLLGTQS